MANFCINCKYMRDNDYGYECNMPESFCPVTGSPNLPSCSDKNKRGDCKDFEPKIPWLSKLILWYRNTFLKKKSTPEDCLLESSFDIVSVYKEPWYLPILKWLMR